MGNKFFGGTKEGCTERTKQQEGNKWLQIFYNLPETIGLF